MLKSLFGELGPPEDSTSRPSQPPALEPERRFAARAMMESVATEVNERGQMVDRHLRDIVVSGSPAQAMRDHFAATRTDAEPSARLITLFDPSRIWASAVVKALSDAGGMPIERLHLREQHTLGTLAMIERTTVVRRFDDALKVYHADVRAPGRSNTEIPIALMERSHLTAVIVGSMQPHAIDDMLASLSEASAQPDWRCPAILFMLPPNASWIANKIATIRWPEALRIQVQNEPLTSASAVWNAVLGAWDRVKNLTRWGMIPPVPEAAAEPQEFPIKVADLDPASSLAERMSDEGPPTITDPLHAGYEPAQGKAAAQAPGFRTGSPLYGDAEDDSLRPPAALDPPRAQQALSRLLATDGVLACALVDSMSGLAIAQEVRPEHRYDIEAGVAACAQVLRAHRLAARSAGLAEPIDEVIVTIGSVQQIIHRVPRHLDLFLFILIDKNKLNLALGRLKILEAEKAFA